MKQLEFLIFVNALGSDSVGAMPREESQVIRAVMVAKADDRECEGYVCVLSALSQCLKRAVLPSMTVEIGAARIGAFDSLQGDGTFDDRCIAVGISSLRKPLIDGSGSSVRWVIGNHQAAHWLMKCFGDEVLRRAMNEGRRSLKESEEVSDESEQCCESLLRSKLVCKPRNMQSM